MPRDEEGRRAKDEESNEREPAEGLALKRAVKHITYTLCVYLDIIRLILSVHSDGLKISTFCSFIFIVKKKSNHIICLNFC